MTNLKWLAPVVVLLLATSDLGAQSCIAQAAPNEPGFCNQTFISCDLKNYFAAPDYLRDLYDYEIFSISGYHLAQGFGRVGGDVEDAHSLDVRIYAPVNVQNNRPVILFSPLSSFATSSVDQQIPQYVGQYFAKKGYVVLTYSSRGFNIPRLEMDSNAVLSDFVDNPYYLSDTNVTNDFLDWRDNGNTFFYGFFDFLNSLSLANDSGQRVNDAYMEMLYKISYDTKYLLDLVALNQNAFKFDINNLFLMGGSAGAVQSMHAAMIDHPNDLDTLLSNWLPYKGGSFPGEGSLMADFSFEPTLSINPKPKAVIDLWGFLSNLGMMDANDPDVFAVHGTWDNTFPFQYYDTDVLPGTILGFGSEAVHHKARELGLNTDLYLVCKGKHALYPIITGNCIFADQYDKFLFDDLMLKINLFIAESVLGTPRNSDIFVNNAFVYYEQTPPAKTLLPPSNSNLTDSNDHCPVIYPEQFNISLIQSLEGMSSRLADPGNQQNRPMIDLKKNPEIQVIPNPFNHQAQIRFTLHEARDVELYLTDFDGRIILHKVNHQLFDRGVHSVLLDTADLPSGMYQVVLKTGSKITTSKLVKLK